MSPNHVQQLSAARDGHQPGQHPRRRGRKPKIDKGLPDHAALLDLANTYLEVQRRLWKPRELAWMLSGLTTPEALAADYETRYRSSESCPGFLECVFAFLVGLAYIRYSCDHSNPRSLDQQLKNVLELAAREGVLIPWKYVFADAKVTGRTTARRGYQMAKELLKVNGSPVKVLIVDELGRANRDNIEMQHLAEIAQQRGIRLRGASDGIDSNQENSRAIIAMMGVIQEQYSVQLQQKVNRGMKDAFLLGKVIQPPAFGYELRDVTDENGRPIINYKKLVVRRRVINESEAEFVRMAFDLFVNAGHSPGKIARRFNELEVGGRDTWETTIIRKMLTRETYVGYEYYRRTRQYLDRESKDTVTVKVPRDEQLRRDVPELRIIPDDLWDKAQARLRAISEAHKPRKKAGLGRTSVYPTMLFRPICGYCGQVLVLGHSGACPSFSCSNGRTNRHQCSLKTYKAVSIVNESILAFLRREIVTPTYLRKVLDAANRFLSEESKRPPANVKPLKDLLRRLRQQQISLLRAIERVGEEGMDEAAKLAQEKGLQIKSVEQQIQQAEVSNARPPGRFKIKDIDAMIGGLTSLLQSDVALAAPILSRITGPIRVTQLPRREGRKNGATWVATFELDGAAVIQELAARRTIPTTELSEYLSIRGWKMPQLVEIPLEPMTAAAYFAPQAVELAKAGHDVPTIAEMVGTSTKTIREILRSAKANGSNGNDTSGSEAAGPSGRMPTWWAGKRGPKGKNPPKYIEHGPEIARLYDQEELSFERIGAKLKLSPMTATKSYDDLLASSFRVPPTSPNNR